MSDAFDYVVIGAGPGGYSSAIRAAQLGLKTAVVERENAGGICLNWGCIPTKALLTSAHLFDRLHSGRFGIHSEANLKVDLGAIIDRSRQVASRLQTGIKSLFKKYGVTLIEGEARFANKQLIQVKSNTASRDISFKFACIATGARARPLPQLNFSKRVWQYRDALTNKELPKSITVIGGGAIGLEFADFFLSLGSRVTLIEMAEHILPNEDLKIADALKKALAKRGMTIYEKTQITKLKENTDAVSIHLQDANGKNIDLSSDVLLVAIGVLPNTENLGIDTWGILDERKFIAVDANQQTSVPSIFALGDVTFGKLLAHRAAHQGIYAAEFLAKKNPRPTAEIPACIYTSPQVATIGLTEKMLLETKREYLQAEFPWLASGMALAANQESGFTRLFTDKDSGQILGAQIVGENASELIGQISLAMSSELLAEDFVHAVFPHPTLSETVAETFALIEGECVNY